MAAGIQRGMDGSLTYGGTVVSNAKVIGVNTARGKINTTVKGNMHEQALPGLVTRSLSFSGVLDYVVAQKTLIDFLENATPDVTLATLIFTVATGKTWTYTSGAFLLGYRITSPEGDNAVSVELDFHLNVQATIAWV